MRDPDLIAWAECIDVSLPSGFWGSVAECNRILHPFDQKVILEAAYLAHNDLPFEAERARHYAGYDYEARKRDRVYRGLPRHL